MPELKQRPCGDWRDYRCAAFPVWLTGRALEEASWSAPGSLEAAMSANLPLVYQMLALYNIFPRTLSVAYLRCRSEALPHYTSAPSRQWQPSRHRRLASPSGDR